MQRHKAMRGRKICEMQNLGHSRLRWNASSFSFYSGSFFAPAALQSACALAWLRQHGSNGVLFSRVFLFTNSISWIFYCCTPKNTSETFVSGSIVIIIFSLISYLLLCSGYVPIFVVAKHFWILRALQVSMSPTRSTSSTILYGNCCATTRTTSR